MTGGKNGSQYAGGGEKDKDRVQGVEGSRFQGEKN